MPLSCSEFWVRSGGSNLNAGSLDGGSSEASTSPLVVYTGGTWVNGTRTFTVPSGNPVSDGVTVGMFVSIYTAGATKTGYVARITSVSSTTFVTSGGAFAGTNPGNGTYTAHVGGAWAGPSGAEAFPFDFFTGALINASSHPPRCNHKNDQSYTTSAAASITMNGVWHKGYTTTPADSGRVSWGSSASGSSHNLINSSGHGVRIDGFHGNGNGDTGAVDGFFTNSRTFWTNCIAENMRRAGFNAGTPLQCKAVGNNVSNTSGYGGFFNAAYPKLCEAYSNNVAGFAATAATLDDCIAAFNVGFGFSLTTAAQGRLSRLVAYANTGSGISLAGSNGPCPIDSCILVDNGGWGIISSGSALHSPINNCAFGTGTMANTSGNVSGAFVEEFNTVALASNLDPFADAAGYDFAITAAALYGTGWGTFVGHGSKQTIGYPDVGAAQHLAAGGGLACSTIGRRSRVIRGSAG